MCVCVCVVRACIKHTHVLVHPCMHKSFALRFFVSPHSLSPLPSPLFPAGGACLRLQLDGSDRTALRIAVEGEREKLAATLIGHGADVNAQGTATALVCGRPGVVVLMCAVTPTVALASRHAQTHTQTHTRTHTQV